MHNLVGIEMNGHAYVRYGHLTLNGYTCNDTSSRAGFVAAGVRKCDVDSSEVWTCRVEVDVHKRGCVVSCFALPAPSCHDLFQTLIFAPS
jgi:hypothetical protein